MPPGFLEPALAAALAALGVAAVTVGAAGVVHEVAAAIPVRPDADAPMWAARACLAVQRCREAGAAALARAVASQVHVLWGGTVALAVAAVWGGVLRGRLARLVGRAGGARFASGTELRAVTRRSADAWFPLGYVPRWGSSPRSMVLRPRRPAPPRLVGSPPARARRAWLPGYDLARHVLVAGLTGAHKTTAITFPVLLEAARAGVSVVALDLKYGEEDSLARAAPEWRRCGRDVLVFAPLEPLSLRWNPLSRCATIGDAHRLAAHLFEDGDSGDPDAAYWMGAERHVCAALSLAVATDGGPPALARLRALCEAGPSAGHAYVQAHPASHAIAARLGAYHAMLPKDQAGILQGIASRLEAWSDDAVCRATGIGSACDEIDLGRLRREPVLLIVGVPQPALGRLRWLCHLFLSELAACLLRPRGADECVRVVQILEELPAWGRLPRLAEHLATFRSRQVSVLATIQSEAQGELVYGREGWAAVAANLVTKIYFPSLADLDAERLSRALGTASRSEVAQTRMWGAGGRRDGEHQRDVAVPLRRPEELQGIGSARDAILVRCAGRPPMELWCPPFHARPEYRGRVPDVTPRTAELAVYHHLWVKRAESPPGSTAPAAADRGDGAALPGPGARCGPGPGPQRGARSDGAGPAPPPADQGSPDAGARPEPSEGEAAAGAAVPEQDDLRLLAAFAERLSSLAGRTPAVPVRCVRRRGRIIEIRVDPSVALPLLGHPKAAPATLRRWAALRWVRRVRPSFVLERRAIEALHEPLRRRLVEACGQGGDDGSAVDVPTRRHAAGEITDEEFERR